MEGRDSYSIEIGITCIKDDESGFELSLDEVVKKIKDGFLMGSDGNEDEDYSFAVKKNR